MFLEALFSNCGVQFSICGPYITDEMRNKFICKNLPLVSFDRLLKCNNDVKDDENSQKHGHKQACRMDWTKMSCLIWIMALEIKKRFALMTSFVIVKRQNS